MATIGGPNTEKDNLVFGYDTGYGVADNNTATRFYAGETATNYLSDGLSSYNVVQAANWNGATPTFTLGTSEFGTPIGTYTVGSTSYMYSHDYVLDDDLAALGGQVVTFSIYLKRTGVPANVGMRVYDNVSGYSTVYAAATGEFQRFTMTKTLGANPTRIFIMIDNTSGGVIDFHSPMLEKGSHATPFVDGSRSSTQSLIDLKRTTDIDVSNASFDSTGQPTLDGSNDQLVVDVDDIVRNASNITIEGMVNATSISSAGPWGILTDHATASDKDGFWWHYNIGNAVYFRVEDATAGEQGTTFSGTVPFVANTYQHIVTVVGDSNVKVYVNGVLSKSYTPNFKWNRIDSSKTAYLHIGRTYPNYYLSCAIPVFKMYNRELSVDEIKQNFNAYKNRFGI